MNSVSVSTIFENLDSLWDDICQKLLLAGDHDELKIQLRNLYYEQIHIRRFAEIHDLRLNGAINSFIRKKFDAYDPIKARMRMILGQEDDEYGSERNDAIAKIFESNMSSDESSNQYSESAEIHKQNIPERDSFRIMYVNVMLLYEGYNSKLSKDKYLYDFVRKSIINEYKSFCEFKQPIDERNLEYIVDTVMRYGKVGYSIMEQLDLEYGSNEYAHS